MHADVIVVGLGAVGSAALHQLARRGARVLGIDRFHPPHDQGSSHGRTRITRLAVGEGAAYVPLVTRSHQIWRQMEAETGASLYRATGALVIASPGSDAGAFHGRAGFFATTVALAQQFSIDHERLHGDEIGRRFPAFASGPGDQAYFEAEGGLLYPERCVAAHLSLARRYGAQLRLGERVLAIEPVPGGVRLRTDQGELHAGQVLLAAGPWVGALAGPSVGGRVRVLRQVLHWLATDQPALYQPGRCPVFIWLHGTGLGDAMYGFPMADGVDGVKVATEQDTDSSDPDAVEREVGSDEVAAMFRQHVRGRLRGVHGRAVASTTCMYTSTADGRFIVGAHPDWPGVTVASPCSGHGFKHSAALGEALAQRLLGEPTPVDLAPFALRP